MTKIVLVSLLSLSLVLFQSKDKGILKFDTDIHDFGRIPHGKAVTYTFKFKNVGEKPIVIFEANPVCGCTIADYTKKPVKKNEEGFVKVTFNAHSIQGFNKAIVVNTNGSPPTKYLTIKGEVY